jgi:hypothetical protein
MALYAVPIPMNTARKMYVFNPMKKSAGAMAMIESLTRMRVITPKNINTAKPPEDRSKMELKKRPTSKPKPPKISSTAVSAPNLLKPKRTNSLCNLGDQKYAMP